MEKNDFEVNLKYICKNQKYDIFFSMTGENEHLKYIMTFGEKLDITLVMKEKINIVTATVKYTYNFKKDSKIFVNGYQSWTDSREFCLNEKMKSINKIPKFIIKKYAFDKYGDYTFKKYDDTPGVFHGYSYAYVRNAETFDFIGSLSEEHGYTIINYDVNKSSVVIEKECEGVQTDSEYKLFDVVFLNGSEKYVFDKYFEMMGVAPLRTTPMSGYTSWYNHYQNISQNVIMSNLQSISQSKHKLDIFQVDDGYQTHVGDWLSVDKDKFPDGMKVIADKIKNYDLIPGIWLAPFVVEQKSDIFQNHKDWLLKDKYGDFVKAGSNWSSFYTLDFYQLAVREYIRKCFDTIINEWGFKLLKLDFLYAVCIIPYNNKSRGQIMCEAMDFLRECVGDNMILGCGVPLAPAFGKVDFCRIGCDIGLDFDDTFIMRKMHRERISTKNAIYNTVFRRQLDKRAFLNDPDVFLLRDDNIKLTAKQKKNLCLINSIFGSLLFTSDNIGEYTDEKKKQMDVALTKLNATVLQVKLSTDKILKIKYQLNNKNYDININL